MRRIIVDGYNVINSDAQLLHAGQWGLEAARHALIARLAAAHRLRHDEVTVVFDGWQTGATYESVSRLQGIRVVYSRQGERADDVIKRLVSACAEQGAVVMVSNDGDLRQHAGREGAQHSRPENLLRQAGASRPLRAARPATGAAGKDGDEVPPTRAISPSKKGPAHRAPRRRGDRPRDYQF